jgi:pyruvate dehydrogenase E2 component (dihydrolipoamide acetyltransferase)
MQEDGFVAKLLFEAGAQNVTLGTAMAVIVERKEDIAAFADYTGPGETAAPTQPPPVKDAPAAAATPAAGKA